MADDEGQASIETAPQDRAPAAMPPLAPVPPPNQKSFNEAVSQGESVAPFGPTNTGSPIPLDTYAQKQEQDSGWQAEHGPRPTRWNVFGAAAKEGLQGVVQGSLMRLWQERSLPDDTQPISPEAANKLFPDRETPYTTPVDPRIVGMEQGRAAARREQDEWLSQAPSGFLTGASRLGGGLAGGLLSPENILVGSLTGGIADLITPTEVPTLGKIAVKYLSELSGFTEQQALSNFVENKMGARKQELGEIASENAIPAAIGVALHTLARHFADGHAEDLTPDALKKGIVAMERDESVPPLDDNARTAQLRTQGVSTPGPQGQLEAPSVVTSPLAESKLYAGVHSDGTPHMFEHGLGEGLQLTDTDRAANHVVAHDNVPGQVAETSLKDGAKLLDLDKPAKEDLAGENSFIKAIEEKTGVKIAEFAEGNDATLKETIQTLGDQAGEHGVPQDILKQIQEIAKEQGYSGYEFNNGGSARTAHIFSPEELKFDAARRADPSQAPSVNPEPITTTPESPEDIKEKQKTYSPQIEDMLREEHSKSAHWEQYGDKALSNAEADLEGYKKQLGELAKTSETAAETHKELREQEAQDARLRDTAKRIAECNGGGGI